MIDRIRASAAAVTRHTPLRPEFGIILGTGLTRLCDQIEEPTVVPYRDIPHFPDPTVASHAGELHVGRLSGRPVVVMRGRYHYYEGYDLAQITHPVRVLRELGVETLVVSNAAGGVNPQYATGDMVVMTDHINLTALNPLRGPNDDSLGPRFPHMYNCYDRDLVLLAERTALELGIPLRRGVYAWVSGPNLETAAEYRYIRMLGADLVGMSTVPEVIVARHTGLKVLGFSIVTDMGLPDAMAPVDLDGVLAAAGRAEPALTRLTVELLGRI